MIVEPIELKSCRSYREPHMRFNQGTNIPYGDNAQGRINIPEAVYVCCMSKSHRSAKDRDIIRFNQNESRVKLQIKESNAPYHINMHLKKSKPKGIAINGVPIREVSELFGIANVVFFSPEDLNIIKNGLSERRWFIDMELCQLDKLYVYSLVQYNRVLLQCNKLLRKSFFRPEYEGTLDVWDMQLANCGHEVIKFRGDFVKQLSEIIYAIHLSLTGDREDITIPYEPYTPQDQMEDVLKRNWAQDMRQEITLSGPCRNDISLIVNDIDIRRFGSQGQQRVAALSLKLSEFELVKQLSHNDPILFLDGVLSELDSSGQNHLLSVIRHIQAMAAYTDLDDLVSNGFRIDKVFKVISGTVINEN